MEQEIATLVLYTWDIVSSYTISSIDNMIGTLANNRYTVTWKNIDLRKLLGEMYDKYETFNIYLYQISQSGTIGIPSSAPYASVDIRISGLPFLNSAYDTVSGNNTNGLFLTSYVLYLQTSGFSGSKTYMTNPPILTFGKSAEQVNITIDMKSTINKTYPVTANGTYIGQMKFFLKINGVPTRESTIMKNGIKMNLLQR